MKRFIIIILCIPLIFFAKDETRLALVIGNANYDKGPLNNPVNDALLVKETLDSLGFDVILDTNISNKNGFIEKVVEFGDKREDYDVAFVYYAGHAIQVGSENYLLPTKVDFKRETDVRIKGFSVQDIMMYLSSMSNKVNVLILDACRDNPFESNWNMTRSLKGSGLAKISPPMGSLIAFSTSAGSTAADGDGKHSVYCKSLCENMYLKNTSLDQVFRNVRMEVSKETNGIQTPEEQSQLTGQEFYLVKNTYELEFDLIDSLIETNNNTQLTEAMELVGKILTNEPSNKLALRNKAEIYFNLEDYDKAITIAKKIVKLYPKDPKQINLLAQLLLLKDENKKAIELYEKAILIDSTYHKYFINLGLAFKKIKEYDKAILNYTKAIELEPSSTYYEYRADCYIEMEDYTNALKDLDKAIEESPEDAYFYNNRADFYKNYLDNEELALEDYAYAIKISDDYQTTRAINNRANIYWSQEKWDLCIEEYSKAILTEEDPIQIGNRGRVYKFIKEYDKAIIDLSKAIELEPSSTYYEYRADCYIEMEDYTNTLKDLDRAIEASPDDAYYYNNRADFYKDYLDNEELALADYAIAIKISDDDYPRMRAINNRANIYNEQEKWDLSIKEYSKAILINKNATVLRNRGTIYETIKEYDKAIIDLSKAIELEPSSKNYEYRADCYIEMEDYSSALKDLDSAIVLSPDDAYYFEIRAEFYKDYLDKKELALEDLSYIVKLLPNEASSYNNRGFYYYLFERYDDAIKDYAKAISIDTAITSTYFYRAKLHNKLEDFESEKNDYMKAVEIDVDDPEGYYYLALFYKKENNSFKAINFFDKAIYRLLNNDNDYHVTDADGGKVSLSDVYLKRAEVYKSENQEDLMCEDYKLACDNGDCEKYDSNCK